MPSIFDLAREATKHFEKSTRPDGTEYIRAKDGAPEYISDLLYAAHEKGNMLPDDYRYSVTVEFLHGLADMDADSDIQEFIYGEFSDGVDIANYALAQWLSSHLWRFSYANDVMDEFGEGAGNLAQILMLAQSKERVEIAELCLSFLESIATDDDETDTDSE